MDNSALVALRWSLFSTVTLLVFVVAMAIAQWRVGPSGTSLRRRLATIWGTWPGKLLCTAFLASALASLASVLWFLAEMVRIVNELGEPGG